MKKIFITGGAGFIGTNLCKYLIRKNKYKITVFDNFSSGNKNNLLEIKDKIKIIKGDVRNFKDLKKSIVGQDTVVHMAVDCVRNSINSPIKNHNINSTGSLNVLEASRVNKVQKFLYISSSEVYGKALITNLNEDHEKLPTTVYGASKLAGELYTNIYRDLYNINTIIIRPFNSYGPYSHTVSSFAELIPRTLLRIKNNQNPYIFGSGENRRDFTYVYDLVSAIEKISSKKKFIYDSVNVGSGKSYSVNQIVNKIIRLSGSRNKPIYLKKRPGDIEKLLCNNKRILNFINYKPMFSIEKGLSNYINWFSSEFQKNKKFKVDKFNW